MLVLSGLHCIIAIFLAFQVERFLVAIENYLREKEFKIGGEYCELNFSFSLGVICFIPIINLILLLCIYNVYKNEEAITLIGDELIKLMEEDA